MSRKQSTLFEGDRMGFTEALEMTKQSLIAYALKYRHWVFAYSGGKDSSATLTAVIYLILEGEVPMPESITVLYADTRLEIPPLQAAAMAMLAELKKRGIKTEIVLPPIDDRFFVYILGRGVPPPSNTFRWCTPQLKIEPMERALLNLRERIGQKLLMITGVRLGESAARDQRISISCGKNGAECGQGWLQISTPEAVADTLAPILHWRVCFVWDWLMFFAPSKGFPTQIIAEAYGGDEAEEINARTGCMCCNLASTDRALDEVIKIPRWNYLLPIKELRSIYAELKKPCNRLRKDGTETTKEGDLVANPNRMGPLTFEARISGLERILDIQTRVNQARGSMPEISLINADEENRIRELISLKQWPNGWDGTEPLASEPFDEVMKDGSVQPIMKELCE